MAGGHHFEDGFTYGLECICSEVQPIHPQNSPTAYISISAFLGVYTSCLLFPK